MTIKEAIIKSLEDLAKLANSNEICDHIIEKKYTEFSGRTPHSTVSAQLGDFIRNGDSRVKRIKQNNGSYSYYLTRNEQNIGIEILIGDNDNDIEIKKPSKTNKSNTYEERDLHKLLSTYLMNTKTYSKTIPHEQSNGKDNNQIWTHPDMVGIQFLNLQNPASRNLLNSINRVDTFKLSSYELKREINYDSELKKAFFQAVSNSSWANYGYLVAFEFSNSLNEEMARLNQSFGIGIIKLNADPFQSKILYPAIYRDLDFKTIDKLCIINDKFKEFIEQIENLMTASERHVSVVLNALVGSCDKYFENDNDTEIENYCRDKYIPTNEE